MSAMRDRIITGDARQVLQTLRPASIDQVVTSPPYFKLRNYGAGTGEFGHELHVTEWVERMETVSHEIAQVLKPTGSYWLNVGDSYALHARDGAARKSLLLAPERLALRLIADGWTIRNRIVWHKPNPMPTSVRDRLTASHETIWLLTRGTSYYFDLDAIRVPHTTKPTRAGKHCAAINGKAAWRGTNAAGTAGLAALKAAGLVGHRLGKNPTDVWTIPTSRGVPGHHATFPLALVERIIRAGCPISGTVLDPFMGAGTTAIAAEKLGRSWLGIELKREFVELAERRIARARGAPPARAA